MGTSTTINGNFKLDIPKGLKNRYLHISSIGYRDTIIAIDYFKAKTRTILLTSKDIQIPEVVVSAKAKKKKRIVLNKLRRTFVNQSMYTTYRNPMTIARYFPSDPTYSDCFITEIKLNFDRCLDFGISPKYFLRVLSYDTIAGKPNSDIIEWTLIEMNPCEATVNYIYTIDMRKYKLQIPKGLMSIKKVHPSPDPRLVVIELIDSNRYLYIVWDVISNMEKFNYSSTRK